MEKKVKDGFIKFRYPNYSETQVLLGEIGLGMIDNENNNKNEDLIYLGRFLGKMDFLIDEIKIKGVKNYGDLLNNREYSQDLNELARELMGKMLDFSSQKKRDSEI